MKSSRLLVTILALLLQLAFVSCREQKNKNHYNKEKENCQSKVISFMFIVDNAKNAYDANHDSSEQGILRANLIDTLNFQTKKIIDMSGGIKEGTDQLFSGCDSAKRYKRYFENSLKQSVGEIYKNLDTSDPKSRQFVVVLNEYFFSDAPYFSDSYFSESNLIQLSYDLFIVQLSLTN